MTRGSLVRLDILGDAKTTRIPGSHDFEEFGMTWLSGTLKEKLASKSIIRVVLVVWLLRLIQVRRTCREPADFTGDH